MFYRFSRKLLLKFLNTIFLTFTIIGFNSAASFNFSFVSKTNNKSLIKLKENKLMISSQNENPYEHTNEIALNYIWPTFPIGFLILGTIGNILSIIIVSLFDIKI